MDLNFMFRVPLWPVSMRDALVGSASATQIPVLDLHELASGKLAALLARQASRDVFDALHLLGRGDLDRKKLRLGFVLYGAMNRKDWRTVKVEDVGYDKEELANQLAPVVRSDFLAKRKGDDWAQQMITECRSRLEVVLPMAANEIEFLNALLDDGRIEPQLLTSDPEMSARITSHPLLLWKALNVREHKSK